MARFNIVLTDGTTFETDAEIVVNANNWLVLEIDGSVVGVPAPNVRFVRDNMPPQAGPVAEEVSE